MNTIGGVGIMYSTSSLNAEHEIIFQKNDDRKKEHDKSRISLFSPLLKISKYMF